MADINILSGLKCSQPFYDIRVVETRCTYWVHFLSHYLKATVLLTYQKEGFVIVFVVSNREL